jgi:hypothetical protein
MMKLPVFIGANILQNLLHLLLEFLCYFVDDTENRGIMV